MNAGYWTELYFKLQTLANIAGAVVTVTLCLLLAWYYLDSEGWLRRKP